MLKVGCGKVGEFADRRIACIACWIVEIRGVRISY